MGLPIEFYVYVGYGLFAIIVSIIAINFILGGLLGPFFKVKKSRGKMILVRVRHPVQDYFRAGEIIEGFLVYKNREKEKKRIPMKPGIVSRAATVYWCEVDDEKNCFFDRKSGEAIGTYDPVRVDNYIVRALTRPGLFGDNFVKIVLILVIVLLIAVIALGYMTYKNGQAINGVRTLLEVARTATATVGVVQ